MTLVLTSVIVGDQVGISGSWLQPGPGPVLKMALWGVNHEIEQLILSLLPSLHPCLSFCLLNTENYFETILKIKHSHSFSRRKTHFEVKAVNHYTL